jgi:hypothetical protein
LRWSTLGGLAIKESQTEAADFWNSARVPSGKSHRYFERRSGPDAGELRLRLQATRRLAGLESLSMRVQSGVFVPLGYGKYVRSDRVTAIVPIEEERGPGRRTFVFLEDQAEPLVASRAEDSVIRDLVREPHEVTRARQQQELLRDIGEDLDTVNETLRQIIRDRSRLDLDLLERRIKDVLAESESSGISAG